MINSETGIHKKVARSIINFIKWESSAGVVLVLFAILALIVSNSKYEPYYEEFLHLKFGFTLGAFDLHKSMIHWINDGLMAIFFLLVGLEIKRELVEGELNTITKAALPGIAAIGGMLLPAVVFVAFNYGDSVALRGWAIPAATDIAFALGLLSLLGSRVPLSLKVLLTAIAIIDDLGAIIIIAIFYTTSLSYASLGFAFLFLFALFVLNRMGVSKFTPYAIVGACLWFCVLKSGVHATLAGVALAMAYPIRDRKNMERSPLREMEHKLHPWIAFGVLPLFAFANAGVPLYGLSIKTVFEPIPLGIACGLFFGKQLGVFLACWGSIKLKIARMPNNATWPMMYGIAILCGIGFTMSLFIGMLAYAGQGTHYSALLRVGVLVGSILSGVFGYLVLRLCSRKSLVVATSPQT